MNKKDKISQLYETIKTIPVSEIIELRIPVHRQSKNKALALCPFHADNNLGSFVITDSRGIWKCFSCGDGVGGDGPKFISMYDKISYTEAILKIAVETGLINEYEASNLSKCKQKFTMKDYIHRKNDTGPKASEDVIDKVYGIISMGNRLTKNGKSVLNQEHLNYLLHRGIPMAEIKRLGYFSFPSGYASKKIFKLLLEKGITSDMVIGVPGFYKENGKACFKGARGIGIPIHDINGKIIAIQIRQDNKGPNKSRYIWYTSSFASENVDSDGKGKTDGCSPGTPIDVVYPENMTKNCVFITEGRFKAAALARTYKSIALSVQGIGMYNGITDILKSLTDKRTIRKIYIAYDADMCHNVMVFKHAMKMARTISQEFPEIEIEYLLWNEKEFKGIDDVLNSGNNDMIFSIKKEMFERQYNDFMFQLMKLTDTIKMQDMLMEMKNRYGDALTEELTRLYDEKVFKPLEIQKYMKKKSRHE